MMTNAFIGRTEPPDDEARAAALGPVRAIWDQLLADLARECGATTREWRCYSPKSGWSLRVKRKQRTIVWLSPSQDCFNVLFIFGAKAMGAARQAQLPRRVLALLDKAPRYPEGAGLRLAVKSARQLEVVKALALIKLAN